MTLIFNNTLVEERGPAPGDEGKIRCYLPYLGRELYLTPDRLYDYKGKRYCYDITTYVIPCEPGDTVSYCEEAAGGILIKKDGLIGFYDGPWEWVKGDSENGI